MLWFFTVGNYVAILSFICLTFLLLLWACSSSSRITKSWRSPDRATLSFKKVVVLGLFRDADRTIREEMEQYLAAALRNRGQWAEWAYELHALWSLLQLFFGAPCLVAKAGNCLFLFVGSTVSPSIMVIFPMPPPAINSAA